MSEFQDQSPDNDSAATVSFSVVNNTSEEIQWYFKTEVLEPLAFEIFIRGQDSPVMRSSFPSRAQKSHASQGPTLRSDLIVMLPGTKITFDAFFEKRPGPEHFPVLLDFKEALETKQFQRHLAHGMFFGAMVTFVLLFLLAPNFLMNAASKWFAAYLIFISLLAMHSHGYGLILLSLPPETYFPIIRALQVCVMFCYVMFALSFLNARQRYPWLYFCGGALFLFAFCVAILDHVLAVPGFQLMANLVPISFILLGCIGALLAVRERLHGGQFFAAGFALLLITGLVNYMASLPRFASWNDVIDRWTMLLQTGDALVFGSALLSQMYGIRRAHDKAVEKQVTEMQRRLDLNAKLRSTEGDLRRARDLAERHRANLAEASHDLRQPITSLRMSLEAAKERSPEIVSDLSSGIEFLDHLLAQTLAKTRSSWESSTSVTDDTNEDCVDLNLIFLNAQRMFAQEAIQKGIALRFVPSALAVQAQTIDIIRIVSNIVSNAVRYTQKGGILVGVRRRGGKAAIEIWDTGSGISEADLAEMFQPYFRSVPSIAPEGEGLGLSIVNQLVEKNNLSLSVCSRVGKGSKFSVEGLIIVADREVKLTSK